MTSGPPVWLVKVPESLGPRSPQGRGERLWVLGVGAIAVTAVVGLLFVAKAAITQLSFERTNRVQWEQRSAQPLWSFGGAALAVAMGGLVVWGLGRRRRRVRVFIVAPICVAVALLAVGGTTYQHRHNPWPGYHHELARLPVPASWSSVRQVDAGRDGLLPIEPPGSWRVWKRATGSVDVACDELRNAMIQWPGTTDVQNTGSAGSQGLACLFTAKHQGSAALGFVADTVDALRKSFLVPTPDGIPSTVTIGPVVALDIYVS